MHERRDETRRARRAGFAALVLIALAWAAVEQDAGANQNAHLALVTALSDGTASIDRYRDWTVDRSYIDGHYFAAKAPGLALATYPWYRLLAAAGLVVAGPPPGLGWPEAQHAMPRTSVWQVGLVGAVLPAFVLLLLVRGAADRLVPGYGTVAAVALGAGSLLGVFATLFFAHALSACLGFAAFALLLRERGGRSDLRLVAAAGALAGLAVVVEFPLGLVALACAVYAAGRAPWPRRAAAYLAGLVAGLAPLVAFNTWAFGSPFTLSYANAVLEPGESGHDVIGANASGFFGVGAPSLRAGTELLFYGRGLVVATPLWLLAVVGLVLLWRQRRRAEAALVAFLAASFLVYNASYWEPFGGGSPGPRFLVPLLPFLALPVAAVWRALPLTTWALALVSIGSMCAALVATPLANVEEPGVWVARLRDGTKVSRTVLDRVWEGDASVQALLVLALMAAGTVLAFLVTPRPRLERRDVGLAVAALVGWRLLYVSGPIMLEVDRLEDDWAGLAGVLVTAAAVLLALTLLGRGSLLVLVPVLALLPLFWNDFAAHTGFALAAALLALAGLAVVVVRRRAVRDTGPAARRPVRT